MSINLAETLEALEGRRTIKERGQYLDDLKHVLNHNLENRSSTPLNDASYQRIFTTLFNVISTDLTAYKNTKAAATEKSAASKLKSSANTIRHVISISTRTIKGKTVRFLLNHLLKYLDADEHRSYTLVASDFAKGLSTVLSYGPHVEHLNQELWQEVISICLAHIQMPSEKDDLTSSAISNIAVRSRPQQSTSRYDKQMQSSQVAESMLECLLHLTSARNMDLRHLASVICQTTIRYLRSSIASSKVYEDCFGVINNIIAWASIENTQLVKASAADLIFVVRKHWATKVSTLKDEMLVSIVHLQPFVEAILQSEQNQQLKVELKSIYDTIHGDYSHVPERDQLQLDDLLLKHDGSAGQSISIRTACFQLRDGQRRQIQQQAEQSWATVSHLARWLSAIANEAESDSNGLHEDAMDDRRARKRVRLTDAVDELIAQMSHTSGATSVAAIQIMSFMAQTCDLSQARQSKALEELALRCVDERITVASWSYIAAASLALHSTEITTRGTQALGTIWRIAIRSLSTNGLCRAASHFLLVMLDRKLPPQNDASELIQQLALSLDLDGPAVLADSSLKMLQHSLQLAKADHTSVVAQLLQRLALWFARKWTPSKNETQALRSQAEHHDMMEILEFLSCILGQNILELAPRPSKSWLRVGNALVDIEANQDILGYLLLQSARGTKSQVRSPDHIGQRVTHHQIDQSLQVTILGHLIDQVSSAVTSFGETYEANPRHLTTEACKLYCQTCYLALLVIHNIEFQDTRGLAKVRQLSTSLLQMITTCLSSPSCKQDAVDVLLHLSHRALFCKSELKSFSPHGLGSEVVMIARSTHDILLMRSDLDGDQEHSINPDSFRTADLFESQSSRPASQFPSSLPTSTSGVADRNFDVWRSLSDFYATVIICANEHSSAGTDAASLSLLILETLKDASQVSFTEILRSLTRDILPMLTMPHTDVEAIMELCSQRAFSAYSQSRSESALSAVVDFLTATIDTWTDPELDSIYKLGLDMYEHLVKISLTSKVTSPYVQQRVSALLLALRERVPDYASQDTSSSTRTSLLRLLSISPVSVQFYLAPQLSSLFKLYAAPTHNDIFTDIQQSLVVETTWLEGIAMRLYILAELGSAWQSLLRQCVYYIFEAAGQIPMIVPYARRCIARLRSALSLDSSNQLFALFSPQLLYSWLDEHNIQELPSGIFDYFDTYDFLQQNTDELSAQLFLLQRQEDLDFVASHTGGEASQLLQKAFDRVFAYALSWDVAIAPPDDSSKSCEARLRDAMGGRDKMKRLIRDNQGAIIGRLLLAVNREDSDEKWLGKKDSCRPAAATLAAMKSYSENARSLPPSQQPHFKAKYLLDQLERLARRLGHADVTEIWDPSAYVLTTQMLFDSMNDALGPLHSCAILQKQRLTIAFAAQVPLQGYALELTLRLLLPYVDQQQCADDTIGMMHYLLQHGMTHLLQHPQFLWSIVTRMILKLGICEAESQHTSTQTSQQKQTIAKMRKFRTWLLTYLTNAKADLKEPVMADATTMVDSLTRSSLPGNCIRGSPESTLLLLLLRNRRSGEGLLNSEGADQALRLLTRDFKVSMIDDCLADSKSAQQYAMTLWQVSRLPDMDHSFVLWSAIVAGRAFAADGKTNTFEIPPGNAMALDDHEDTMDMTKSHKTIAARIVHLSQSNHPRDVSIALSTLRAALRRLIPGDLNVFQRLYPLTLLEAVEHLDYHYSRQSLTMRKAAPTLKEAFTKKFTGPLHVWTKNIALAICEVSGKHSFTRGLTLLLDNDDTSADLLLPSLTHLILLEHSTAPQILKDPLSESIRTHLLLRDSVYQKRQRVLLDLILYLLQRPYPIETTLVDRLAWIDCDYVAAAHCASHCQMPATALMLAEMARCQKEPKRKGLRQSMVSVEVDIPLDLLLGIYQNIDEPDSYYGVQQEASLQSFLDRAEYEGNAAQALTASAAKLGSRLIRDQHADVDDGPDLLRSLSAMNLDSLVLLMSKATSNTGTSREVLYDTAQVLRQWDLSLPEQKISSNSLMFRAFQTLSHAVDVPTCISGLKGILSSQIDLFKSTKITSRWSSTLASITELLQVVSQPSMLASSHMHDTNSSTNSWMETADFEAVRTLVYGRCNVAGVLACNKRMLEALHLSSDDVKQCEVKALIMLSSLARAHGVQGLAQDMSWLLQDLVGSIGQASAALTTLSQQEIASVLWDLGDSTASIAKLQGLVSASMDEKSTVQAVVLSQIGMQLANARLERPSVVLEKYLRPAIEQLQTQHGHEAGRVYHTFAVFCDAQLQNPDSISDFHRISRLRQAKLDEVDQLKVIVAGFKKTDPARKMPSRNLERAKQWFAIDDDEYQRLKRHREVFAEQSLKNYMLTLSAIDKYDICVLRFFALWLEYADNEQTQATVKQSLGNVPTWKFVVLMNQLMSRLKGDDSELDKTLLTLLMAVCQDHPYHTVHHLYAARKFPGKDDASAARRDVAEQLCRSLSKIKDKGDVVARMLKADSLYRVLAEEDNAGKQNGKYSLRDSPAASRVARHIPKESVPPATVELPLQPDGQYNDVPIITSVGQSVTIMTGLSAPKVLTIHASNGKHYRQLFKGGNDDLRQDAIMEQVFSEVSKMLRNHKSSRQRDLHIRTYKVIPLSNRSGIIEFVPNSIPINDFLQPAHLKYYPGSLKTHAARQRIAAVSEQSREVRVKEFKKVCDQMPPVLRYFFFERFKDPDEWFKNRTAYTRTTATISMLGQILGLGDRHCHNILLDERSGEVIHIDLGVAFEAGRVLPIPELVPFRLTRDIVDGMGITGVEGIFRRCAEFTLDALRKDKDAIMTLLNVLRYDPLYVWTLSPIKAKQMQQQQQQTENGEGTEAGAPPRLVSSKTNDSEAGEAERALSIVEKKLGNALSTAASVSELIQQATDERNLATLFNGWAAFF